MTPHSSNIPLLKLNEVIHICIKRSFSFRFNSRTFQGYSGLLEGDDDCDDHDDENEEDEDDDFDDATYETVKQTTRMTTTTTKKVEPTRARDRHEPSNKQNRNNNSRENSLRLAKLIEYTSWKRIKTLFKK